jgi:hypothetical protein
MMQDAASIRTWKRRPALSGWWATTSVLAADLLVTEYMCRRIAYELARLPFFGSSRGNAASTPP